MKETAAKGASELTAVPLTSLPGVELERGQNGLQPMGGLHEGDVLVVSSKVVSKALGLREEADELFALPPCMEELAPVLELVPLQLLARSVASALGRDVDRPRNLAKSVTTE